MSIAYGTRGLTSRGILKAGSRGAAPGGVSGERCLGDSVKGPPESLPPLAPEGGVQKNLHLKGGGNPAWGTGNPPKISPFIH